MLHASKPLAITMVELFQDADLRTRIRSEFDESRRDKTYAATCLLGSVPVPISV